MSFLPIVERELRVTARNPRLYWTRFGAALIAVGLVAWFWIIFGATGSSAVKAKQIFGTLSGFAFLYCLLLGPLLTADAISEEKRDGTLGLLFLTDLKGYDVALGKLFANSLRAVYGLIAIFPVLTIPLLLGGLAGIEVARMLLVLTNTLLFSLSLGLLVSSISRNERMAQFGAFLLVAFFTAGMPILVEITVDELRIPRNDFYHVLSPAFTFATAASRGFATITAPFWTSVAVIHALSWIAFLASALIVRRVWQDRPASGRLTWNQKLRNWKRGSPERRRRYREALLKSNAYYWLAARDRFKPAYVFLFLAGCASFWGLLWLENGDDMFDQEALFVTAVLLHLALKIWLASEAGRQFYEDRRNSALELTLSTPLPVRDILEGQFLAMFRQFGWAIGLILLFDLSAMILGAQVNFGPDSEWILTWAASMIILVVDAITIVAYGMWLGLSSRRSSRALLQSIFFVLILPWLIIFGLITYMALARFHRLESYAFMVGAYFIVSLAVDFVLFTRASSNLTQRFREIATQRFESSK